MPSSLPFPARRARRVAAVWCLLGAVALPSACAARRLRLDVDAGLARGDRNAAAGCHRCLTEALAIYTALAPRDPAQRAAVEARVFRTSLLLALREKELGLDRSPTPRPRPRARGAPGRPGARRRTPRVRRAGPARSGHPAARRVRTRPGPLLRPGGSHRRARRPGAAGRRRARHLHRCQPRLPSRRRTRPRHPENRRPRIRKRGGRLPGVGLHRQSRRAARRSRERAALSRGAALHRPAARGDSTARVAGPHGDCDAPDDA